MSAQEDSRYDKLAGLDVNRFDLGKILKAIGAPVRVIDVVCRGSIPVQVVLHRKVDPEIAVLINAVSSDLVGGAAVQYDDAVLQVVGNDISFHMGSLAARPDGNTVIAVWKGSGEVSLHTDAVSEDSIFTARQHHD